MARNKCVQNDFQMNVIRTTTKKQVKCVHHTFLLLPRTNKLLKIQDWKRRKLINSIELTLQIWVSIVNNINKLYLFTPYYLFKVNKSFMLEKKYIFHISDLTELKIVLIKKLIIYIIVFY